MIANPNKFHGIILKKNRSDTNGREITIKGNVIETERDVESLGIIIDNKLSFKKHISSICKKASGKLNAIKRLRPLPCKKSEKTFDRYLRLFKSQLLSYSLAFLWPWRHSQNRTN